MTEKFDDQTISPMRSFYEGLSNEERLALAEAEGWRVPDNGEIVTVITRDLSDMPPDDIIATHDRITFLRFTTQAGVIKTFHFVHDFAIDLAKLNPVEYGASNDAVIHEWSMLEWNKAKESALAQALQIIDQSNRQGLRYEFVQIEAGQQVEF